MKIFKLGIVTGMALALAACPDQDRDVAIDAPAVRDTPVAERPADAPMVPPGAERADLQAVSGAAINVSGEVAVAPRNGNSHVMLILRQAPPNESIGARVQSGTCESPGPVVANLDAVRTDGMGRGHSETNVGHAPHLILDGNHIAAVYAPGTEPERDRPIACVTLPEHGMAAQPGMQQPGTTRP
jgi:hypothetical protein